MMNKKYTLVATAALFLAVLAIMVVPRLSTAQAVAKARWTRPASLQAKIDRLIQRINVRHLKPDSRPDTLPHSTPQGDEDIIPLQTVCDTDLDRSGVINSADINLVIANYGRSDCGPGNLWCSAGPDKRAADIDHSGAVNFADKHLVIAHLGQTCEG